MRFLALLSLAVASGFVTVAAAPTTQLPFFAPGRLHYDGIVPAPLHAQAARQPIAGHFIVVLKAGVDAATVLAHRADVAAAQASSFDAAPGAGIRHVYDLEQRFQGYAGAFSDDVLAYIRAHPAVEYVEQDTVVSTTEMPHNNDKVWDVPYEQSIEEAFAVQGAPSLDLKTVEKGSPWGLVRISHREQVGFKNFGQYVYNSKGGEGTVAYIIDTGINIKHVEFEGRAIWGKTMPANDVDEDGNGHGTHCAGTIGSRKYGVAKKATLVAVKVLGSGGSGSMSDVTGGVLWAANNATAITKEYSLNPHTAAAKKHKGFVANMSLGGGKSPSLDKAVNGAVDAGLHFAVAAGNENADACNTSPAGADNPVTVAASTITDERAYFSNKGKCVDIAAPGLNILSTWNTGNTSTNTISGTSMATPHIVGLLAYLLSVYGTPEFYEGQSASVFADAAASRSPLASVLSSLPLPSFATNFLGFLFGVQTEMSFVAPIPKTPIGSVIAPSDLKKALQKLATKDVLSDMTGTINLLSFNNATDSTKNA